MGHGGVNMKRDSENAMEFIDAKKMKATTCNRWWLGSATARRPFQDGGDRDAR
jgi:hypothetical protein